jgi:hypothetical protein
VLKLWARGTARNLIVHKAGPADASKVSKVSQVSKVSKVSQVSKVRPVCVGQVVPDVASLAHTTTDASDTNSPRDKRVEFVLVRAAASAGNGGSTDGDAQSFYVRYLGTHGYLYAEDNKTGGAIVVGEVAQNPTPYPKPNVSVFATPLQSPKRK